MHEGLRWGCFTQKEPKKKKKKKKRLLRPFNIGKEIITYFDLFTSLCFIPKKESIIFFKLKNISKI